MEWLGHSQVSSLSANLTVEDEVDKTYNGRRYQVDAYVPSGSTPKIRYTCDYLELDDFDNEISVPKTRETSLRFGPNLGDLPTNSLSVSATGVDGQYPKSLSAPVGRRHQPPAGGLDEPGGSGT